MPRDRHYAYASDLRNGVGFAPSDEAPGWYRWYAKREDVETLLNSENIRIEDDDEELPFYDEIFLDNIREVVAGDDFLIPRAEMDGETYYCIYVGIAAEQSLYERIVRQHIRKRENLNRMERDSQKALAANLHAAKASSLRMSISALVAGDCSDGGSTDEFIDRLVVGWTEVNHRLGSNVAIDECEDAEDRQLESHIIPLNIVGNDRDEVEEFKKRLLLVRREAEDVAYDRCGLMPHVNYDFIMLPYNML